MTNSLSLFYQLLPFDLPVSNSCCIHLTVGDTKAHVRASYVLVEVHELAFCLQIVSDEEFRLF